MAESNVPQHLQDMRLVYANKDPDWSGMTIAQRRLAAMLDDSPDKFLSQLARDEASFMRWGEHDAEAPSAGAAEMEVDASLTFAKDLFAEWKREKAKKDGLPEEPV